MTRDDFVTGFAERTRNVLQKHEREMRARTSPCGEALFVANANLDATIDELARFAWDAMHAEVPA